MLDAAFQNTLLYELIHVFILLPLLPMILLPLGRGAWTAALVSIAVNLLVNFYPIMVQRYNCARVPPRFRSSTPVSNSEVAVCRRSQVRRALVEIVFS
jgi:hypothetical protein